MRKCFTQLEFVLICALIGALGGLIGALMMMKVSGCK